MTTASKNGCPNDYRRPGTGHSIKPGFYSNAIACVGKQPIMVATASTEQALAFEWKPGFTYILNFILNSYYQLDYGLLRLKEIQS